MAAAIGLALATPVLAANFSFTSAMSEATFADDSRAVFGFLLQEPADVTLRTWSYAGGVNAAGQQIPAGGFDPIVSVFNANGALVVDNDDGSDVRDPVTGSSYDSLVSVPLSPGEYQAVLTQFSNFWSATNNAFSGSGGSSIADGRRTGNWALDILSVDGASFQGIDLPGSSDPIIPPQPDIPPPPTQEQIDTALQGIAVSPNAGSVAAVIANACPQAALGTRFREDCTPIVVGALDPVGTELNTEATAALVEVTPQQVTVPLSSSRASMGTQQKNIASRIAALRAGGVGLSVRGLTFAPDGQLDQGTVDHMPYAGAPGEALGGAASGDAGSMLILGNEQLGVFVTANYTSGDQDRTINQDGFDFSSWGVTAGVDYRFRPNLVLGLALGYTDSSSDLDANGGTLDVDSVNASLYGTWAYGEHLLIDGNLTYLNSNYDQKRNFAYAVGPAAASQTAKASYGGEQWSGSLGIGYQLARGPWSFGPVARLEYLSANVDGYQERMSDPNATGGAWASRIHGYSQDSFTSSLGGEVSYAISTTKGVILPQLSLAWIHEFEDAAVAVNGTFIQDPTQSLFRIVPDRPDTDYFNARLGVSTQLAGGIAGFVYYDKVFGYRNLDMDAFGAGVRMTF